MRVRMEVAIGDVIVGECGVVLLVVNEWVEGDRLSQQRLPSGFYTLIYLELYRAVRPAPLESTMVEGSELVRSFVPDTAWRRYCIHAPRAH